MKTVQSAIKAIGQAEEEEAWGKSTTKAIGQEEEPEKRFSVGFDFEIDVEDAAGLDEDAIDDLIFKAAEEAGDLFGNPVEIIGFRDLQDDIAADAEFKHWVDDLKVFKSIIDKNDTTINDGIVGLPCGVVMRDFVAARGHWGHGGEVDFENWDDGFFDKEADFAQQDVAGS